MAIGDVLLLPFFSSAVLEQQAFHVLEAAQQPDGETTTQEKFLERVLVLFFFSAFSGFFKQQLTFTQKLHANNDDE